MQKDRLIGSALSPSVIRTPMFSYDNRNSSCITVQIIEYFSLLTRPV